MSAPIDVLLSHGYVLAEDEHEREVMRPYPPLGLMYLSSYLKAQGLRVELVDTTFGSLQGFARELQSVRPFVLGLYSNLMTRQALLSMIAAGREAGAYVVLGGPEAAPHAEEYLRRGAHVVVDGEGEATLDELVRHLRAHGFDRLEQVRGTIFVDASGAVRHAPPRPQLPSLDALPWPDREAIDLDVYLRTWKTHHGASSVSLITARGCPYTCTWCSHAVFGLTHRRRSVKDVADEVEHIRERYAPDRLWYADDVFTIHTGWSLEYAGELKRRGLRLPFECISRADRLDERMADALAEMGCERLWIGAESGSQRILDAMQRRTRVEDVQHKTRLLQARGISVGMFIMLGYEGEQPEDLLATAAHLKAAAPDIFLTTVAYPIKGTRYHSQVQERVHAAAPWERRTDRGLGVAGRRSRRFYEHATRWLVNEVNLERARRGGTSGLAGRARMYLAAQYGRFGMRLTDAERETPDGGAGRGWAQPEAEARR